MGEDIYIYNFRLVYKSFVSCTGVMSTEMLHFEGASPIVGRIVRTSK